MPDDRREKILVIEDEPIIAADIASIVSGAGHIVTGISNSYSDAIRKYKSDPADIIIVDIQLHDGSSGITSALEIKNINPSVVIVFITAFPERLLTGERPEPTFLITKPFQPATLLSAITQAVSRRPSLEEVKADPNETSSDDAERIQAALEALERDPLGARFSPVGGHLVIDALGAQSDIEAANRGEVIQLHEQVRRRSASVAEIASELGQQHGWEDLEEVIRRFIYVINRPTDEIPHHIGELWSEAVELGSFLELDEKIRRERPLTNMSPLDPVSQRKLASLVRVTAPWVRLFPTARNLDEQSGSFLSRTDLFTSAVEIVGAAGNVDLLSTSDRAILQGLIGAADRGELQGQKARSRSVASARNLTISAILAVSSFYGGSISNEFAAHSKLTQKIGLLLANTVKPAEDILLDMAPDIRFALESIRSNLGKDQSDFDIVDQGTGENDPELWINEIQTCVENLGKSEFTLQDIYQYESELKIRHPQNNNIQAKIRQQLQILRDRGWLEFNGRGTYRRIT